jgi:hypothetical protein
MTLGREQPGALFVLDIFPWKPDKEHGRRIINPAFQ